MPIQVICPGCLQRFSVSEKFAGKQGPCPKCKAQITIPKPEEQVVIHTPVHEAGAVAASGRHTLRTFRRKDAKFQPIMFTGVVSVALVIMLVAFLLRGSGIVQELWLLALSSILLGPPLAWAGYTFLRDPELEAYTGVNLIARAVACGLVYALLWGVYMFIGEQLFHDKDFGTPLELEIFQMIVLAAIVLGIGTFAAYVSFDLEPFSGFFNCALFFAVTVLLRVVIGLPAIPGLVT